LAPVHVGRERGMDFHVFTDETRPLLQGARLSAYELQADGIKTTLICDNMASTVMKNGWVQAVFVGADRIAANGDTANKIGTSGVAILARYYGIPFYVCAPLSTFDIALSSGTQIPIEQRNPDEIAEMWYKKRMAPEGIDIYNPAFDVTDHSLISGFVTEAGILKPDFTESIASVFAEKCN
ncbi:MAG: S-methyl-5-thioribose-1-phosphate isomerase, partial [Clostridia bacterium]|nr:S-methyl-5-thioribose-1-phosphate isomerase [Clostridia bacterium]